MGTALEAQAVVGRRVELAYYRDQDNYLPGIIVAVTDSPASLRVRLDGARSSVACRADYGGLRYLEEVVRVPDLPMGRFHPTAHDFGGITYEGVLVCEFEDGDLIVLSSLREKAIAAARAYLDDQAWIDLAYVNFDDIRARWVTFEWQPEDAECPWLMTFAQEGDDQALHIHYLPA